MWSLLFIATVLAAPSPEQLAKKSEQIAEEHDGFACIMRRYPAGQPEQAAWFRLYKLNGRFRSDLLEAMPEESDVFALRNPYITRSLISSPLGFVVYHSGEDSAEIALHPPEDLNASLTLAASPFSPVNSLHHLGDLAVADVLTNPDAPLEGDAEFLTAATTHRPPGPGQEHQISVTVDVSTGVVSSWTDQFGAPEFLSRITVDTELHPEIGPVVTRYLDVDDCEIDAFDAQTVCEFTNYQRWTDESIFEQARYFPDGKPIPTTFRQVVHMPPPGPPERPASPPARTSAELSVSITNAILIAPGILLLLLLLGGVFLFLNRKD